MWDKVGILRNESGLLEAREEIAQLMDSFKRNRKCLNEEEYEYRNMLTAAILIIDSALSRKESRGAHSRSDYKFTLDTAAHSSVVKTVEKELIKC